MCGRYRAKSSERIADELQRTFAINRAIIRSRYNIAPSQTQPVVCEGTNGPMLAEMRWGFIPFWEKAEKPAMAPINARSEGAFQKPMFRQAIQTRRCAIPADGFFEWQRMEGGGKQPYDIHLMDDRPFFFAGIYADENVALSRPPTFLLFTTAPNSLMAPIHDRMPAMMEREAARQWLAPGALTPEGFARLVGPFPSDQMQARPISSLVNNPRNDSPAVLEPLADLF